MVFLEHLRKFFSICAVRAEKQFGGAANLFNKVKHATRLGKDFCKKQSFALHVENVAELEFRLSSAKDDVLGIEAKESGQLSTPEIELPFASTPSHAGNTVFGSGILLAVLFTLFKKSSATSYQIPDERMYWRAAHNDDDRLLIEHRVCCKYDPV
jgi:hypothetical protein